MIQRWFSFLQRIGKAPVQAPRQVDTMSDELRIGLWNALDPIWQICGWGHRYMEAGQRLIPMIAADFFRWPLDSLSADWRETYQRIRAEYGTLEWQRALDFIDFVVARHFDSAVAAKCNEVLEREGADFRFINGRLTPVTSEAEVQNVAEAMVALHRFPNAMRHLQKAATFLGVSVADYENSIKESISAVEALCQALTNNPKATLGDALKTLEQAGRLHPALKTSFSALYGYTSEHAGIRHGKGFGSERATQADARFMLVVCSALINYVTARGA